MATGALANSSHLDPQAERADWERPESLRPQSPPTPAFSEPYFPKSAANWEPNVPILTRPAKLQGTSHSSHHTYRG